jgi:hypothetical protein
MKAVPKAFHTGRERFWLGSTEMSRQDTSPSPTMRDAPWEHDQGEKPKGIGRTAHTDAPTRTRTCERYGSVHGHAGTMFVCAAPPLGRRPEHKVDRLTPARPPMGRLLEHGVSCRWPNEVQGSTLRPCQGGVCPPPSLQGAWTLVQHGSDASTHTGQR